MAVDFNTGDQGIPIWILPSYKQETYTQVTPGSVLITVPTTAIYQVGLTLDCDEGTLNFEPVEITEVNSTTTFTATFTKPHGLLNGLPTLWTISGGLIPSGATVGVAFIGKSARVPTAAATYAAATSQNGGAYALYTTTGTDFTVADLYEVDLNTQGTGYNLTSTSDTTINVRARR